MVGWGKLRFSILLLFILVGVLGFTSAAVTNANSGYTFSTIQEAINNATSGDTINVGEGSYDITSQINIQKSISIIGNGNVILNAANPSWSSTNGYKHLLGIYAGTESSPITITNIIVDCNNQCYGVNTYSNAYGILNDVTIRDSKGAGLTVNGVTIIADNLHTSNNNWGAVNVDPGNGVTTASVFTLNSGDLTEGNQIWSDGAHVSGSATVSVNAVGYKEYITASNNYHIWTNRELTNAVTITKDSVTKLYSTIQSAIDAASAGETIKVYSGTYNEKLSITKNNLIIEEAEGATAIIHSPDETFTSVRRLIDIRGNGVTFRGFEVVGNGNNDLENYDGSYLGIRIEGYGITVENNIVRDLLTGIQTTSINPVTANNILGNTISNVAVGISLQNDGNNVINNNINAINEGFGLASFNTHFENNLITVGENGYEAKISYSADGVYLGSIQDGINAVSDGDTVYVSPGLYNERITINKSITLRGATYNINKNGYEVPTNYEWDESVESIINNPEGNGTTILINNVSDVTIEGFVIQALNRETNNINHLIHIKAESVLENVNIINNIIGPNTNVESQDGKKGRMNLNIDVGNSGAAIKGLENSLVKGNKIFGAEGDGVNLFIIGLYSFQGSKYSSLLGTIIEDNEIYGSHRTGIETAGGIRGLIIRDNKIYGNNLTRTGEENNLKYGHGILIERGSGDRNINTTNGAFVFNNGSYAINLTIENNEIYNNQKSGIYFGPMNKDYVIINNNIHNNGWEGIMIDFDGSFCNPVFETCPHNIQTVSCYNCTENVNINSNRIENNNGKGIRIISSEATEFILNAKNNYWGTNLNFSNLISGKVSYTPWFTDEGMTDLTIGQTIEKDETTNITTSTIENEINLTTEDIIVTLPENLVISSTDTSWDGTILPPTIRENATVEPNTEGLTETVSKVIEVGFEGVKLILSNAVKIVIPGETGKKVGYSYDGTFYRITTECINATDYSNIVGDGECYFDDGADIIIWTKHFTEFMTYEENDTAVPDLEYFWWNIFYPRPNNQIDIFANFSDAGQVDYVQIKYNFSYLDGTGFSPSPEYQNMNLIAGDNFNGTYKYSIIPSWNADGYLNVKFKANDRSGNESEYNYSSGWLFTITYDGTKPETEIIFGEPNYTDENLYITDATIITLNAMDLDLDDEGFYNASGITNMSYTIKKNSEIVFTNEVLGNTTNFNFSEISGSLEDGEYVIEYYSQDNAGNVEDKKSETIILDNTSPIINITGMPEAWQNFNATASVSCLDSDSECNLSSLRMKIYLTNPGICSSDYLDYDLTTPQEISSQVWVCGIGKDNLGNTGFSEPKEFMVDKLNSNISIISPAANSWQNIFGFKLNVSDSDTGGSGLNLCYYRVESRIEGTWTITKNWTSRNCNDLTPLITVGENMDCKVQGNDTANGNCRVSINSTDVAGNSYSTLRYFKVDWTAPETTDNSDLYSDWQAGDVTIILTPSDINGSGVASTKYCVYSDGETECEPTTLGTSVLVTCADTEVCEKYVRYFSVDNLGNSEEIKNSSLIKIDKQNPVSEIVSPENGAIFASDFLASLSDSDVGGSGLASCEYQVTSNGSITLPWTTRTCSEDLIVTVGDLENCRDEGTNICELKIRSIDNVGKNYTVEKIFSIDWTNAPQILSSSPSGTVVNNFVVLQIETNKLATCKYDTEYKSSYDAMTYTMDTTGGLEHTQTISELTDKSYNYYFLCEDTTGNNMLYPATITFDVDTRENFIVTVPETKGDYLRTGWNQFFLPSFVLDNSTLDSPYYIEDVLESIDGSYNSLYHFDGSEWKSYVPGREVNDLTHFNGGGFPYFVDMSVDGERIEIV